MPKFLRYIAAAVVTGAAAALLWYFTRPPILTVSCKPVLRGTLEQTVANTRAGTVTACRRAKLAPSIGGQIARLPVKEGDQVDSGTLLLEIWNDDLQAQLLLAEREEQSAQAQAEAACQTADGASRQAQRARQLLERRVTSEEAADTLITQAKTQQAQCRAATTTVQVAAARVAVMGAQLSRTRLHAPFAGIIARIEGELNEYVTPSPVGVQIPPVIDLIENSCFYVTAPIDEVDAAAVRVGMTARISLDAYKNRHFTGTVRRIAPFVRDLEKQARTVDIEAAFSDPADFTLMLAGYSADVEILVDQRPQCLHVASEAIIDGKKVLILGKDGYLREKAVTLGLANWSRTEIISGLGEGEQVVTNVDKPGLRDGERARLAAP